VAGEHAASAEAADGVEGWAGAGAPGGGATGEAGRSGEAEESVDEADGAGGRETVSGAVGAGAEWMGVPVVAVRGGEVLGGRREGETSSRASTNYAKR